MSIKLSIITINLNNSKGLVDTLSSVSNLIYSNFEHIVIDGGSTDDSVKQIEKYVINAKYRVKWLSEKDKGIYNAMNKGIVIAEGEYCQFLNAGDVYASNIDLNSIIESTVHLNVEIIYGNMLKVMPRKIYRDKGLAGRKPSMLEFYTGTINHSSSFIKRDLFHKFGYYDESYSIVSDWKWFLEVVLLHNVEIKYIDKDFTVFDMNGISNTNSKLEKTERQIVLQKMLPLPVIHDYEMYGNSIQLLNKVNSYWFTWFLFRLMSKILFKVESLLF